MMTAGPRPARAPPVYRASGSRPGPFDYSSVTDTVTVTVFQVDSDNCPVNLKKPLSFIEFPFSQSIPGPTNELSPHPARGPQPTRMRPQAAAQAGRNSNLIIGPAPDSSFDVSAARATED